MSLKLDLQSVIYVGWLVLLIFLLEGLFSKEKGIFKVKEVISIKTQLIEEIKQLEKNNQDLETEILSLRTDPFWVEKIAREDLDMVKPGEVVIKFRD